MKQRRTKILALFLAAAMAVGSPATAFSVSAEDWVSADEMAGFGSDGEVSPEDFGDAAEDDFFGSEEELVNEVTEEIAGEAVGTETTETGIGEKTEYADGTYVPDDFSFLGGTGKTRITCPSIVIENGVVYGNILFSSKKYTKINLNDKDYPVLSNENGSLFKIPVILNQDMVIKATTVAMTEAHDIDYTIKITQDTSKFTPKPEEKADYTAVDAALAKVPSDLSVYTDETAKAVTDAVAAVQRDYGKSRQAEVDAMASAIENAVAALVKKVVEPTDTELAVNNTTAMFNADKAVLHQDENGSSLIVTLSGSGYHYLYKGTYEEAVANGDNRNNWCAGTEIKAEGSKKSKYQFTIPVAQGETKLALVAISNKYLTKYEQGINTLERAFYPRQAVIDYAAKTLVTGDYDHTVNLSVANSVKMFKISTAAIHTLGGPNSNTYKETLQLTMGSDSFDKIYVGTEAEAESAENTIAITDRKAEIVVKSSTVDYLDKDISFSFYSVKNKKWYERIFNVSKNGKTLTVTPVPVPATGVTVDVTEQTVGAGESFVLTANVEPKDSTDKVVWSSSDEKVATVDQKGNVKAVGEGTAVITAQAGKFAAECKVTVHIFETIPAVNATCTRAGLTEGVKCSVCGTILKAQEKIPALGHKAENLPAIAATCTKDGWSTGKKCSVCGMILSARKLVKATGHKEEVIPAVEATPGHTGLTEGKKCSVCGEILETQKETPALPEIPSQVLISKVTLTAKGSVKVAAGKKIQLAAKITPGNADNKDVTWTSSNKKVATVNSKGVVTMKKKAGGKSVVITATAKDGSNVYGSIKLTCMKGAVKKITISGNKSVKAGKTLKLKAKVTASSKANKKVAWSSSNKKLATVNSKGVVKTFKGKKGTVKITVRSLDGTNKKKTVTIKIK